MSNRATRSTSRPRIAFVSGNALRVRSCCLSVVAARPRWGGRHRAFYGPWTKTHSTRTYGFRPPILILHCGADSRHPVSHVVFLPGAEAPRQRAGEAEAGSGVTPFVGRRCALPNSRSYTGGFFGVGLPITLRFGSGISVDGGSSTVTPSAFKPFCASRPNSG